MKTQSEATPKKTSPDDLLTAKQVAELYDGTVSQKTVFGWVYRKTVPFVRTRGGRGAPRFRRGDVEPKAAEFIQD